MGREIKFRVWDQSIPNNEAELGSPSGEMIDWEYVRQSHYFQHGVNGIYPLMQYTGLTDKNGVEIYEGDIIEHEVRDKPYSKKNKKWVCRKVVVFDINTDVTCNDDPVNCIEVGAEAANGFEDGCYDWSPFYRCEVIGNIYEKPELLGD